MRTLLHSSPILLVMLLAGCGAAPRPDVGVDDFQELRTYGWESIVPDPEARWNPESYQVLARSIGGFVLLEEGRGKQQYFAAKDKRETFHPVWINRLQFGFGPNRTMIETTDGRLVPNSEGLTVVTLTETRSGKDYAMTSQNLTNSGSWPKVWGSNLVAQFEDRIQQIDELGTITEIGPGFFAEPQRNGPGICWQERPVFETDHWSGSEAKLGRLFIRWKPGTTTELANAVEARWTRGGGIVATVLRGEPAAGKPWWSVGTDIYYVAGPKAAPVLVAADARSPSPHPSQPVIAAVGANGSLILCSLDGRGRRLFAPQGDHPQWSYDGLRLIAEEALPENPQGRYLKVYIFKLGGKLGGAEAASSR